jgi:ribosomal protein S6--L-glutamate ligase
VRRLHLYFLLVRRVPPVPSPVLEEAMRLLRERGFRIDAGIAEETATDVTTLEASHDLYILKSHTELSLSLAGCLHQMGARLLNPYESCGAVQNKFIATRLMQSARVPTPKTWIVGDLRLVRSILEEHPVLVKPRRGHRGTGVRVLRTPSDLEGAPPPDEVFVVQEYIEGSGEDLKVFAVGDEVFGTRKTFSATSFAEAGRPCPISSEVQEIALRCGKAFGLGLYGLDFVEGPDGPVVVDLNYFPGYKGVPGAAARIAEYIEAYARGEETLRPPRPAGASRMDVARAAVGPNRPKMTLPPVDPRAGPRLRADSFGTAPLS